MNPNFPMYPMQSYAPPVNYPPAPAYWNNGGGGADFNNPGGGAGFGVPGGGFNAAPGADAFGTQGGRVSPQPGGGAPAGGGGVSDAELMQMMQQLGLLGGGPGGPGGAGPAAGGGRAGSMIQQGNMVLEVGGQGGGGGLLSSLFSLKGLLGITALAVGGWFLGKRLNLFNKEAVDAVKEKFQDGKAAFEEYMTKGFDESADKLREAVKVRNETQIAELKKQGIGKLDEFNAAFSERFPGRPDRETARDLLLKTHNELYDQAEGGNLDDLITQAKEALDNFYKVVVKE